MARKWEMFFPYVFAAVLTICCTLLGYDVTRLTGFNEALGSVSTICSVLLGFMASMFSILLAQKDKNSRLFWIFDTGGNLFSSYYKQAYLSGFSLLIVNTISYFRLNMRLVFQIAIFYIWIFTAFCFLGCCIRVLYFLVQLIRIKDEEKNRIPEESEAEKQLKNNVIKEEDQ